MYSLLDEQPTTVVLSLVCAIPAVKYPSYLGYLFSNDVYVRYVQNEYQLYLR